MPLSRRQKLALKRSVKPINVWFGSVRSSKTHASLWAFIRIMAERAQNNDAEGVVLVVGLSTNTVWRNIFQPLATHSEFAAIAPHLKYRQNAPTGTLFGMPFSVVGANNESSWMSIQGMTVAYCLGDEATGWPRSFWDMLISRLTLPQSRLLVTCNPGSSSHYLKRDVIDGGDPDVHVEKFLLRQNPFLPAAVVARLERIYTGLFHRRMILGEWVAAEGAIYQAWDPTRMVVNHVPDGDIIAVGLDYGTQHPSAAYALKIGVDGKLYLCAEWSPNPGAKRLTDSELADSFTAWLEALPTQPRYIYADPAAASFREELKRRGVHTYRADNAVVPGIRTVESLLTTGALLVSSSCKRLIDEIPGYMWDAKAAEKGIDQPIKENDDHCDAARYVTRSSRRLWGRLTAHPTI